MTTCATFEEAESLAFGLLDNQLAACVQIDATTSFYRWKGKREKSLERRLMIKTLRTFYPDVEEFLLQNHSYEVPEIVMLPIDFVSKSYLIWVNEQLSRSGFEAKPD